jgi:hypothetical protein
MGGNSYGTVLHPRTLHSKAHLHLTIIVLPLGHPFTTAVNAGHRRPFGRFREIL